MQNLCCRGSALAQCRANVMAQTWADEQTLGWPIQDLQPWANRAASDGPMEGQCIRAIWVVLLNETWALSAGVITCSYLGIYSTTNDWG